MSASLPTDQQPEEAVEFAQPARWRRVLRGLMVLLLLVACLLCALLYYWTWTNEGSRQLLSWVASQQHLIKYQYASGNLHDGVILRQIRVHTKPVDILIEQGVVQIGWRAIVQRELHFRRASLQQFQIIKNTPPSNKPFEFKPIKLPFTLRFDEGYVRDFSIKTSPTNTIRFPMIILKDAVWAGDTLSLHDSSLHHAAIVVQNISGTMRFRDKYPLDVKATALIPALKAYQVPRLSAHATGSLDTIKGTVGLVGTDNLSGQVQVRPMQAGVPYQGDLQWTDLLWPIAKDQMLRSAAGQARIEGTTAGLMADVQTDLMGKAFPKGAYQVRAHTNFKGVTLHSFRSQILGGQLDLHGQVDWAGGLRWHLVGRSDGLQPHSQLPQTVLPYVPEHLNAKLATVGALRPKRNTIGIFVQQDQGEVIRAGIAKHGAFSQNNLPLHVDARWQNLTRDVAGVGTVRSVSGRAHIQHQPNLTLIDAQTSLAPSTVLPQGDYQAQVKLAGTQIEVSKLLYRGVAGSLGGAANVRLAHQRQPLTWTVALQTAGLKPRQIVKSLPLETLTGQIQAKGESRPDQQLIKIVRTDLAGVLASDQPKSARRVQLDGTGQAVLLMHTGKSSGLKGFDARFDGRFNTAGIPGGHLKAHVNGTPKLLNIKTFEHQGDAGNIQASGQVNLSQGVRWQLATALDRFDPSFFVAGWQGNLTGQLNTLGAWDTQARFVKINQMNLQGVLRQQPLVARGQVDVAFAAPHAGRGVQSYLPQRVQANDLLLQWAGNRLMANGNQQSMHVNVDAPALQQIHPKLSGRIQGQANLTGQLHAPDLQLDLSVEQLKFDTLQLKLARLTGTVPELGRKPSQLTLIAQGLQQGERVIPSAKLVWSGVQTAHVLQANIDTLSTQISAELAGGFRAGWDWVGQLQQGQIQNRRMSLAQEQPAALMWRNAEQSVALASHCWRAQNSDLCLTEPVQASAQQGNLAIALRNLELRTFRDFMPTGMIWTGLLNGQAKASWQAGQAPTLDALLYTDNGTIGLTADDPQDPPMTLPYQRLSLLAQTQAEGIKVRFDAKTPDIGTGYIDAIINPQATPKTINGALVLDDVQLSVFQPFFPGMRALSGMASLAGGMSGPLTAPAFYGEFKLDEGRVVMANLPVNLNRIQMRSSIRGTQASIKGEFYSGDGKGTLDGQAVWAGDPAINLKLGGENLLIRQPPQLTARLTPALDIGIFPARRRINIDGEVNIPSAVLSPTPTDASAVPLSADIRVVDHRVEIDPRKVLKAAIPWRIDADIDLNLGKSVFFRGFGANAPLAGNLHLRQRGYEGLSATGTVGVQRAVRVDAFGQSLLLRRGEARFSGSLTQPILDIEAVKSVEGRNVGVRIGGRPTNPAIVIFNDAGLSEQEALNALLTGRISSNNTVTNTAGFKSDVNNTLAAAGLSFGLSGSRNFTNKLGRTFGLSGLTVDAEGVGDDTQVNVTGYISPDLYLRYGVGVFTPVNKLTLRYQVNRRLYIEASSALEKAIDIFYNWRF